MSELSMFTRSTLKIALIFKDDLSRHDNEAFRISNSTCDDKIYCLGIPLPMFFKCFICQFEIEVKFKQRQHILSQGRYALRIYSVLAPKGWNELP